MLADERIRIMENMYRNLRQQERNILKIIKVGHPMKDNELALFGLCYCRDDYYQTKEMYDADNIVLNKMYQCYGVHKNAKVRYDMDKWKLYLNIDAYFYKLSDDFSSKRLIKNRTIKGYKKFYLDMKILSRFCSLQVINNELSMIAATQSLKAACNR